MGHFSTVAAVVGDLVEHADSEATIIGTTVKSDTPYYSSVSAGSNYVSASITITKRSLIVVSSFVILLTSNKRSDIKRDGVSKTKETIVSPENFAVEGGYCHLQYATEILDPGTYTYNVVNTATGPLNCYGAAIKIVAVTIA
jgi:hypothetical protein